MQIFDNFLPKQDFMNLANMMLYTGNFPWQTSNVITPNIITTEDYLYNFQMVHTFFSNQDVTLASEHFYLIKPFIDILNPLALVRAKANLTTKTEKIIEQGWHTDYGKNVKITTGVYYLNTNDGYTKFENGEVIESVENRLVLFDSDLTHTGSTTTNAQFRCVINFNFIPFENNTEIK